MRTDSAESLTLLRNRIKARICALDAERESLVRDLAKADALIALSKRQKAVSATITFIPRKRIKRGSMGRFIQDSFREADHPVTVPEVMRAWIKTLGYDPLPHERHKIRELVKYYFKALKRKGLIRAVDDGGRVKGWRVTSD